MNNSWQSYTDQERLAMLQHTSQRESLPDYAVEKDWWVVMVLRAAFQTSCASHLLFKGGTSLSKGWGLIKRFSEDIDLAISHKFFRDTIENNNQLKTLRKQSRKFIVERWVAELNEQLSLLGAKDYSVRPLTEIDGKPVSSDADPTVVIVEYPSVSATRSAYMASSVKVEVSCLSMQEPNEPRPITSMIHDAFPAADPATAATIPTVLPSRTFLEKAFLLCEEFQKDSPRSLRMSRHLYDLFMMMDTRFGHDALADDQLYTAIVEHRRKFYHVSYADYDKDYRDRIEFYPPQRCIKAWETDYAHLLRDFVYGHRIPFAVMLQGIARLQEMFRARPTS